MLPLYLGLLRRRRRRKCGRPAHGVLRRLRRRRGFLDVTIRINTACATQHRIIRKKIARASKKERKRVLRSRRDMRHLPFTLPAIAIDPPYSKAASGTIFCRIAGGLQSAKQNWL
jgi:hypothetical protein